MAKCSICGKSVLFGIKVSHSHKRSNKMFRPNVKRVRIQTDKGNKKAYVCTACLRGGAVKRAETTVIVHEDSQLADSVPTTVDDKAAETKENLTETADNKSVEADQPSSQ